MTMGTVRPSPVGMTLASLSSACLSTFVAGAPSKAWNSKPISAIKFKWKL